MQDENKQIAIRVGGLYKTFKLPHEKQTSLKQLILRFYRKRTYEKQRVLKNISFTVNKGEFFGVVGRNGSGKSTLLKLLAGIYTPDKGSIEINDQLTPFIELGVGFNPELTGRENVYLNGVLLGMTHRQIDSLYDEIVKFAELDRFMDQKLKNYSSGMQVRLAFSIAINADTGILLLDEVLAVGDAAFQKKCFNYFRQLKKDKKTVVFISHDMNAVREYCERAVLLEDGKIIFEGTADKVAEHYTRLFTEDKRREQVRSKRWGTGGAKIKSIRTDIGNEQITIFVECIFRETISQPIFGMTITNPTGIKIYESNTKWERLQTGEYGAGDTVIVSWCIPNIFTNGENLITPAIADVDGIVFYDHWEDAAALNIDKDGITTAITLPRSKVKIDKGNL